MHLPTATFRASGSLSRAGIVARDYVRVMSDMECLTLMTLFLNRDEGVQIRLALQQIPDNDRLYRFGQFRDDEPLMVSLALHAQEPETLQALADSMYCEIIGSYLRQAGYSDKAEMLKGLRKGGGQNLQLQDLPPLERRFGTPLGESIPPTVFIR